MKPDFKYSRVSNIYAEVLYKDTCSSKKFHFDTHLEFTNFLHDSLHDDNISMITVDDHTSMIFKED